MWCAIGVALELDGGTLACRRFGNTESEAPPLLFLLDQYPKELADHVNAFLDGG